MRVEMRIRKDTENILAKNIGGLTYDELYQRLDREYGNGRTLNRKFLRKVIGDLFRNGKLQTYKLDGQKILQLK